MQSFNNRPQFGRWLVEQVNSGWYDGLLWLDSEKTTFRIPWKHNSRKDCNEDDNRIFREWAVVSGKILENPNDKAKWKTNFRCALHSLKTQFELVHDFSKANDHPHKVYKIISPDFKNIYENVSQDLNADQNYPIIEDVYVPNTGEMLDLKLINDLETLDLSPSQQSVDQVMQQPWCAGTSDYLPEGPGQHAIDYVIPPAVPVENPVPISANDPPVAVVESFHPALPPIYELEITINYRKKTMLKTSVCAPRLQLHYQQPMAVLEEQGGQALRFPTTEGLLDRKQIQITKDLLELIQGGVLLEVDNTGVYGTRRDRCKVFTSTRPPHELLRSQQPTDVPHNLERNTRQLLLSFDRFINEWKEFKDHKRGSPDYTIYLCFGQTYPDGKPLHDKLIVVQVVPVICRVFHERAQLEGASSLNSGVSLQISHNSLFDLISSTFGLPMQE